MFNKRERERERERREREREMERERGGRRIDRYGTEKRYVEDCCSFMYEHVVCDKDVQQKERNGEGSQRKEG